MIHQGVDPTPWIHQEIYPETKAATLPNMRVSESEVTSEFIFHDRFSRAVFLSVLPPLLLLETVLQLDTADRLLNKTTLVAFPHVHALGLTTPHLVHYARMFHSGARYHYKFLRVLHVRREVAFECCFFFVFFSGAFQRGHKRRLF